MPAPQAPALDSRLRVYIRGYHGQPPDFPYGFDRISLIYRGADPGARIGSSRRPGRVFHSFR